MKEDSFRLVYITCKDFEQAKNIGKEMVTRKLSACANILPSMHSIYIWKDQLEEETECVLLLKTKFLLINEVIQSVKSLHSYENPCIIALEIKEGSQEYLSWIQNSVI